MRFRIIPARAGFTTVISRSRWSNRDHPRSRGVYKMVDYISKQIKGSSPLARGLHLDPVRRPAPLGIIPARAGFTLASRSATVANADHPRSRGVYHSDYSFSSSTRGSSPLARGLPVPKGTINFEARIIPARAGFTRFSASSGVGLKDHPRSRGVYNKRDQTQTIPRGSSPLARGLLLLDYDEAPIGGIIPARAGFTDATLKFKNTLSDHPRSRGVYRSSSIRLRTSVGSSPLARGLPCPCQRSSGGRRIIPARAGFTHERRRPRPRPWDHPRSRGVYLHVHYLSRARLGSSPLARGLPALGDDPPAVLGIIPARAGFTIFDGEFLGAVRDHPRSRGVYLPFSPGESSTPGSSPLARGLQVNELLTPCERRIIPARAGFTRRRAGRWVATSDHPRSRGVYPEYHRQTTRSPGSSPLARGLQDARDHAVLQ